MPVTLFTEFDAIPTDIANALSVGSGRAFFDSIEWFSCLATHGLSTDSPRIYVAYDDDGLQCAVYCQAQGRKLQSLGNFYTIVYGPVLGRSGANEGLAAIASHIATEQPSWTTIDLRNLRQNDLLLMQQAFSDVGFATHNWNQHNNWFLDVSGQSFEDYFGALSSQLRNTIKRKSRKAEKTNNIRIAIFPCDDLSMDQAIRDYQAVYAASWKESEPFPDFMSELIRTCDRLGLARVGLAWVDDQPAAAQLWINEASGKRSYIYKLAYDEKFASLSIGSMLSKKMFEHAIDVDGIKQIDYGVGDEPYKRDWMNACRNLSGLLACNRQTLVGQLRHLREVVAGHRKS